MGSYEAAKTFFGGKSKESAAIDQDRVRAMARTMAKVMATYDSARPSDEFKRYWANADAFDADSAHSKEIRHTLIRHSRYEQSNNGYADGIAQTYSTDVMGIGPSLRLLTENKGFNRTIENQFHYWATEIRLRQKLWTMAHAKHVDGEAFGILRRNESIQHRVDIDIVLFEAEQCSTPFVPLNEPGYIDGIKFDEFGNPLWYDFLREHPGATSRLEVTLEAERIPADRVLHWFKVRRPGQHRGVPETSSTLNLGAAFRRLREASLSTAEKVAAFTLFLKSLYPLGDEARNPFEDLDLLDIDRGMLTTLPDGMEPFQLKSEQPGPDYTAFHRTLLNEQARPKNMPFNKAACDSASYNYASGRLDHQTYYAALDVDRADCNDMVLEPLFTAWFEMASLRFGWLGSRFTEGQAVPPHVWDWPKHRVADVEAEANANLKKLSSGQILLPQFYAEQGVDFDDAIEDASKKLRIPEDELLKRLVDVLLPPVQIAAAPEKKPDPAANGILQRLALNGAHSEN